MSNPIKVGLVGFGMSGQLFHAPFIDVNKNFELKKVVERHDQKSQEYYPDVEIIKSFDELLSDDAIPHTLRTEFQLCNYPLPPLFVQMWALVAC